MLLLITNHTGRGGRDEPERLGHLCGALAQERFAHDSPTDREPSHQHLPKAPSPLCRH